MTYANVDRSSRLEPRDLVDPGNSCLFRHSRFFVLLRKMMVSIDLHSGPSYKRGKVERSIC